MMNIFLRWLRQLFREKSSGAADNNVRRYKNMEHEDLLK